MNVAPPIAAPTNGARALALFAGCFFIAAFPAVADAPIEPPRGFEIHSVPITSFDNRDPDRRRFGALEFRGGLELTSPDRSFGELSGLRIAKDGAHFIAVGDKGRWFRGRIDYRDGRPAGISEAETAPVLGANGRPLAERGWFDTESIAQDGGTLYVGIERVNQIVRFDYGRDGLLARGEPIAVPPEAKSLPFNQGFEALAFVPSGFALGGTLIAISERGLDAAGNIVGFLIGGPSPGTFAVRRSDEFDVTDAAVLPDGDLLILERRYSPARGVAMRLRRVALGAFKPGATVDGSVLVEADLGYQIDNMEGLGVHRAPGGEIVITIVSDNNFNVLQRTILLQFTLVE